MMCAHHQLNFEIDDSWLAEAGVDGFTPGDCMYIADQTNASESEIFEVAVSSVEPALERANTLGIFCEDRETGESAKTRVVRILSWFRDKRPVEPVKVVRSKNKQFNYKLVAGCHRFYCAVALGFEAVPATMGFDINDTDA